MSGGNASNAIRVADLVVEHTVGDRTIRAVDIASLEVQAGSSVAIMGPSGCGKSTLLGVLAGLAVPTSGSVTIGTTEISALSDTARIALRRTAVGMVYQADNLLPFLTITENLLLQLAISEVDVTGDATDRVATVLERLGLGSLGDRLPDQLSGGQRQRGAVARAIVHDPSVILADEPTGALDDDNASAVVALLGEACARLEATLLVVTHDPVVAAAMGRVVTLRDGSIVDDREAIRAR